MGFEDESLAIFGSGIDSFIEAISGFGIVHMALHIQQQPGSNSDTFERTALCILGFTFYALVGGLVTTSAYKMVIGHKPETTFWGVIIALLSILVMLFLIVARIRVEKQMISPAILADEECTEVCIYMFVLLLLSSGIYDLTNFT